VRGRDAKRAVIRRRRRSPWRPLGVAVAVLVGAPALAKGPVHRGGDVDRGAVLGDVVGPNDVGTAVGGERGRGDGGVLAVVFPSADRAVHRLVGVTDQHRTVERGELPDAVDQIERLGGRLTEAEPGVDDYLLSVDPGGLGSASRSRRAAITSSTTSSYSGSFVGSTGASRLCITTTGQPASATTSRISGSASPPGHVVDDVGAGVERSRRDGWLPRIHRD